MKSPEYVATVVKIYKKYINEYINSGSYTISDGDFTNLMQVFNRGSFSTGHLLDNPNNNLIYKEKSNNQGIYLGTVQSYAPVTGHIKLKLETNLSIGDSISISSETGNYTVSEMMIKKQNIRDAKSGDIVTLGRMKGNISFGDKIYKMSSKELSLEASQTFSGKELKKEPINATLTLKLDEPITLAIDGSTHVSVTSDLVPQNALSNPITKERLIEQISKTGNTPYEFKNVTINMEPNLFIPSIGKLNELRRLAIEEYQTKVKESYKMAKVDTKFSKFYPKSYESKPKISVLLNKLSPDEDFTYLNNIDDLYIPYSYFLSLPSLVSTLCSTFNVSIYLPSIIRNEFEASYAENIQKMFKEFKLSGAVISNIGQIQWIPKSVNKIGNFTLNIFNAYTISELKLLGFNRITLSPELNKISLNELSSSSEIDVELLAYGRLPLMTMQYCPISHNNKCPATCTHLCRKASYELKDRLGFIFKLLFDQSQTITTLYNSKITWLPSNEINSDYINISFLDETEIEKKDVITSIISGNRLQGIDYTNANFSKEV